MHNILDASLRSHVKAFLTLPGEEVLIATRKHWIVLVQPLAVTLFLTLVFTGSSLIFFLWFYKSVFLLLGGIVFSLLVGILAATKIVVDWYFNLYIITTRKILEFSYSPLFSHMANEIMLDQVRITEVDVHSQNMLQELLNYGDVVVVFDHISHEERVVLSFVPTPNKIGVKITDAVATMPNRFWYPEYRDILPRRAPSEKKDSTVTIFRQPSMNGHSHNQFPERRPS